MNLSLIRHAHTEWNGPPKIFQGHYDIGISDSGIKDAKKVKKNAIECDFIVSSPAKRCVETASIIHGEECIDKIDKNLLEIDTGSYTGISNDEIKNKYSDWWKKWKTKPALLKFPDGESLFDLANRACNSIIDNLSIIENKKVLYVTHGGVIRILLCIVNSGNLNDYWKYNVPNLEINLFDSNDIYKIIDWSEKNIKVIKNV